LRARRLRPGLHILLAALIVLDLASASGLEAGPTPRPLGIDDLATLGLVGDVVPYRVEQIGATPRSSFFRLS
jgi:hypothetical protein